MGEEFGSVTTNPDGSVIYKDADGNVVYAQDAAGNAISGAGGVSPIVQQFANLVDYWGRSEIAARNRTAQLEAQLRLQQAGLSPVASASIAQLMPLALLAGGAFIVYKILKG